MMLYVYDLTMRDVYLDPKILARKFNVGFT
jgi:hypothetical protein